MAQTDAKQDLVNHGDRRAARVAVIGAGAAGLAAARELKKEGHAVVVFEQSSEVGGVWVYDERVETDKLGNHHESESDGTKNKVHSSVYASVRTNLPREVMGYASFPFTRSFGGDKRRFCGHEEVRAYLDAYADFHDLRTLVRTKTKVLKCEPLSPTEADYLKAPPGYDHKRWGPRWGVTFAENTDDTETLSPGTLNPKATTTSIFDAVVVCNGHYSTPRVPNYPHQETWPGLQMHSHDYRRPEHNLFGGKKVVVLGNGASGEDLSLEIAGVAREVILAARGWAESAETTRETAKNTYPRTLKRSGGITKLHPTEHSVTFENGVEETDVDVVIYATGYAVTFPFFLAHEEGRDGALVEAPKPEKEIPSVRDNRVAPLWEHVFPPHSAPSLSFVGLPWKVVPFPQFEVQSRWIALALSGAVALPGRDKMMRFAEAQIHLDETNDAQPRHHHRMGDAQFGYNDRLLNWCGEPGMAAWRAEMYRETGTRKRKVPTAYRDPPGVGEKWGDETARVAARTEAADLGFVNEPLDDEAF